MTRPAKLKKGSPTTEPLGEETFSLDPDRTSELRNRLDEAKRGESDPLPASKVVARFFALSTD